LVECDSHSERDTRHGYKDQDWDCRLQHS